MLDSTTKQLINSARDILVGKVPDPKSQIEQITLALIYKFMDDMDRETVEKLKGKPKFFAGDFAKYSWRNIFNPTLGGHEMLALYAEALEKMNTNPGIHQFFREIFKNAFLPYRSPETLKLFLKTINEFNYDHSENLGNAYEYLLSILGTQGDAGQFRTPRHIIDFIVKVIDPQKHETILDPACGTAGFLLAAYKHILSRNTSYSSPVLGEVSEGRRGITGDKLTPDDRKNLATNLTGYDIDPNMERFALVNMFLHGFVTPQIHEYDTLSSQDRWNEYYDVILANPPFMSPKGGIRPHNRFSVKSNRSEVLFVDYIAEHLVAGGRAGVIVPEGIIFQSGTAYRSLRKMLVEENYLVGVISLPAGVFNPYSGVKTSILWLDKTLAKKTDKILFVKISSDGFDLGAQRRSVKENDLNDALIHISEYKQALLIGKELNFDVIPNLSIVEKSRIGMNGEFALSGDRYIIKLDSSRSFKHLKLGDICHLIGGGTPSKAETSYWKNGTIKWISSKYITDKGTINGYDLITDQALKLSSTNIAPKNSTIIITRVSVGKTAFADDDYAINQDLTALIAIDKSTLLPKFLFVISKEIGSIVEANAQGIGVKGVTRGFLSEIQIPVPSLSIQQELVSEIESYQKIIDGARQVVENYKPRIEINPGWTIVKLGNLCTIVRGSSPRPKSSSKFYGGNVPRLMVADITRDGMYSTPRIDFLTEEGAKLSRPMDKGSVIITVSGNPGLPTILAIDACIHDGFAGCRNLDSEKILPEFLYFVLLSDKEMHGAQSVGAVFRNLNNDQLRLFNIPLPNLSTQRRIVEQIEREQALVRASKELVEVFEGKIRERVKGVWGG